MYAAEVDNLDTCKLLLEKGADVNLKDKVGCKIYGVGSFTALKTFIFQDHQNIRKIELYQVDLIHFTFPSMAYVKTKSIPLFLR